MIEPSHQFKHHSVRDLVWAVSSAPLMARLSDRCAWPDSEWYQIIVEQSMDWLIALDCDPAELDELLAAQKDRRLGKYFETLWYYWLSNHPRYDVVENNVQINMDGKTLGEIDFILFDKVEKKTIHWELAIKFYLGVGDTREMCNWHGPNLRDRLDKKVDHLLNKQSVISQDQRVVNWLAGQGIKIDQCAVILKGRLYLRAFTKPAGYSIGSVLPWGCPSNVLLGRWFKQSEFDEEFSAEESFLPLVNKGWLARISTESTLGRYAKRGIFDAIVDKEIRYPLQVQLCSPRHSWDRAFIVDENWPGKFS